MDIKLINENRFNEFDIYKANSGNEELAKFDKGIQGTKELEKKDIDKMVNELNKHLKKENTYAKYDVHSKLGDIMIKIISADTKEVIIEFPPEKILDMVAKLCEDAGIVLNKKA